MGCVSCVISDCIRTSRGRSAAQRQQSPAQRQRSPGQKQQSPARRQGSPAKKPTILRKPSASAKSTREFGLSHTMTDDRCPTVSGVFKWSNGWTGSGLLLVVVLLCCCRGFMLLFGLIVAIVVLKPLCVLGLLFSYPWARKKAYWKMIISSDPSDANIVLSNVRPFQPWPSSWWHRELKLVSLYLVG